MVMADIQWTDDKVGELIGLKNNINFQGGKEIAQEHMMRTIK